MNTIDKTIETYSNNATAQIYRTGDNKLIEIYSVHIFSDVACTTPYDTDPENGSKFVVKFGSTTTAGTLGGTALASAEYFQNFAGKMLLGETGGDSVFFLNFEKGVNYDVADDTVLYVRATVRLGGQTAEGNEFGRDRTKLGKLTIKGEDWTFTWNS